jgi:heme-degrading monooxygenase HmoA
MFSVIFEVKPKSARRDEYLSLAKELKPILEGIDGFIDNERFESNRRPGWVLSHSTWRDEKSVVRWRTQARHHEVQQRGREDVFEDYHLRVGDVVCDTTPPPTAPVREMRFDETEIGDAKYATLTEVTPQAQANFAGSPEQLPAHIGFNADGTGYDIFASIYNPGKLALLAFWQSAADAQAWAPGTFPAVKQLRHRVIRIVRDYGMFDRREAPQYYPPRPSQP